MVINKPSTLLQRRKVTIRSCDISMTYQYNLCIVVTQTDRTSTDQFAYHASMALNSEKAQFNFGSQLSNSMSDGNHKVCTIVNILQIYCA